MASVAATRIRSRMQPSAEPNVIPFIDVLLVLLIIFMVTAPKPTTDLRLDLPRQGEQRVLPVIPPTIIELREDDSGYRLYVGGVETTLANLRADTLQHITAADPVLAPEDVYAEARVFIQADLDVAYQNVIAVTDQLQTDGFAKVAILAQDADAG